MRQGSGYHKQTHGNNGQLWAGAQHESWEDRMYSKFARSRHSGGSTPACQRWEADHSSHEVRKAAHFPELLSSWHHPDENWVHHTGNSEEVQGHAWGISSYRAQGLCLKGDLPQHQAPISACSVGWHSLPWSCHVARIE